MSQITIQCQCKKVSPNSETWETSIFFPRNSEKKKCWERKREKWMLDVGKESPGEITREREQFIFDIIFKCRQCPRSFFLCLLSSMRKNWLAGFCFVFFWPHLVAHGTLVLCPGIKPLLLALEAQNLNCCTTREVLKLPAVLQNKGFPDSSAGKKIRVQYGRPEFNPWVGKIPWRRERLPTPVFWPGEFHGLYCSWGRKESDSTE